MYMNGGIYFGSRSNALDDYEEGTWTPVFAGSTTTVNQAVYTKIGDLVFIQCYISFNPENNSSQAQITGLPFPVKSIGSNYNAFSIGYVGAADWQDLGLLAITTHSGGSYIYFHQSAGNAGTIARSDFYNREPTGHALILSGCYKAA